MSKKNEKADYSVNCVSLMCSLFELFSRGIEELGVTELSMMLHIHKNKATKLLYTLEMRRYLERNSSTGGYRLGYKAVALRASFLRGRKLIGQARPSLEKLAGACGETVILAVPVDGGIICEDIIDSTYGVRAVFPVGRCLPPTSAAGRLLSPDAGQELVKRECCLDLGENDPEVFGAAAPIRDHAGKVIGAVSVLGPSIRFRSENSVSEVIPLVMEAAQEISLRLGYLVPTRQVLPLGISKQLSIGHGIASLDIAGPFYATKPSVDAGIIAKAC